MKTIYAGIPNGLRGACTAKLLEEMVKQTPEYLTATKLNETFNWMWEGNEEEARFGSILIDDTIYILNCNYSGIDGYEQKMRTDLRVIELFEKYGKGAHTVVDLPDGMEWEVWSWEYGEESIHEKHRYWN